MREKFKPKIEDREEEETEQKNFEKEAKEIEKLEYSSEKLKSILGLIDENIFPENPLPVKIVKKIESKYKGKIPAAKHYFDENEKGEMINEHYRVNKGVDKGNYEFIDLKGVAIHETRHRIQHALKPELFNKENIKGFKEKYPALTFLIDNFPKELSPEDFDACLVENLSLSLIRNNVSLSEILENIISKNPEEILKNVEELAKEHGFEIPNIT